jgi:hypothetical protein
MHIVFLKCKLEIYNAKIKNIAESHGFGKIQETDIVSNLKTPG